MFGDRTLIVVTVWEPGLATTLAPVDEVGGLGMGYVSPSPERMAAVDRTEHEGAIDTAAAGVLLAVAHGATAEPLAVADEIGTAETVAAIAEQRDAEVIVVGSRGLGAFKAGLLGSTSRDLLKTTRRPVLVVKAPG